MASNEFFNKMTKQSEIKSQIVAKYFAIWAKIIVQAKKAPRINYIDLFSGPGLYEDGNESTPIKVISKAIADPAISGRLQCYFNDSNPDNIERLKKAIFAMPDIEKLKFNPTFMNTRVGDNLIDKLDRIANIPSLMFLDPWGYKGLSPKLIQSVIQHWGGECIFFFNYNRINMALDNYVLYDNMADLFGENRASDLLWNLRYADARLSREFLIMDSIAQALLDIGGRHVLTFRFATNDGSRTSHYLVFVTKIFRGYEKMKEEMAKLSRRNQDGTYAFEYSPSPPKGSGQGLLFDPPDPIEKLCDELAQKYAGRHMTMYEIFEDHSIYTKFIKKDYKDALKKLANEGRITSSERKRKDTFADDIMVHFPQAQ